MATTQILSKSFDKVAVQYDRSRPTYSSKIFENFSNSFRTDCKCIVEVGAGTGLFTQLLIDYFPSNTRIIATEPLKNMRDILCEKFSNHHNVEIYHSLANNLSVIDDNSVDAIFCAQSFHWFSNIETLKEFQRILSPNNNSYVVLVWNIGGWRDNVFFKELIQRLHESNKNAFPQSNHGSIQQFEEMGKGLLSLANLRKHGLNGFDGFEHKWIKNTHEMKKDSQGLIDLILSWSGFACSTNEEREKASELIQDTIVDYYGSLNVKITIPYHTHVKFSQFSNYVPNCPSKL